MLKSRPERIQSAVEALPPKKAPLRNSRPSVDAFREQLLSKPVEALARVRLREKALETLPQLATERRNAELRERVLALSVQYAGELRWPTLGRLLPWVIDHDPLRKAVFQRCSAKPPDESAPLWLRRHWKQALARNHGVSRLVDIGLVEQHVLALLLPHLELKGRSPLAEAVLSEAISRYDRGALLDQPWTETLRFIEHSGAPWGPRRRLLRGILAALPEQDPASLRTRPALQELMALSRSRLGSPRTRPGAWLDLPPHILALERAYEDIGAIRAAFPTGDTRAERYVALGAAAAWRVRGVVLLELGEHLVAERHSREAAVRVWPRAQRAHIQALLEQGAKAAQLPEPSHRLDGVAELEALLKA
ncbi:MAG: hypothetical protein VX899_25285 [Myxococcota bacterium]|nr:hypothetical protein [Myxococcota bacterium]